MEVPIEQQQPQQVIDSTMTPEQQEEMKLRMKYPNPHKPGGSTFIQKMLHKGNKKYFDSGDYNMAKSRTKAALQHNNPAGVTTTTTTVTVPNNNSSSLMHSVAVLTPAVSVDESSSVSPTSLNNTANNSISNSSSPSSITTPTTTTTMDTTQIVNTNSGSNSNVAVPTSPTRIHLHQHQPLNMMAAVNNNEHLTNPAQHQFGAITTSSLLSSQPDHSHVLMPNPTTTLTSSTSTQPLAPPALSQLSTSISSSNIGMISSSLSSEKLVLNSIDHQTSAADLLLLDSDEIGHGIPTPECLPQSRKHSMTTSKLAASPPHLSTSSN